MRHRPPISTRLPYTTLFRSQSIHADGEEVAEEQRQHEERRHGETQRRRALPQRHPARERPQCEPDAEQIIHRAHEEDRKSTRLNSSHLGISYAVFCLKKKTR